MKHGIKEFYFTSSEIIWTGGIFIIIFTLIFNLCRKKSKDIESIYDNEEQLLTDKKHNSSDEQIKISINDKEEKEDEPVTFQVSTSVKTKLKMKRMWLLQLKVVLWKNLIIRKRHWFLTICEALIPVSLFLLIAYGRSQITGLKKNEIQDATYCFKRPLDFANSGINVAETQIYYSPQDDFFSDLIHRVQEKFQFTNNNIHGFHSEEHLLEEYARSNNNSVIAIIFNSAKESTHLDYTIRSNNQYFSGNTNELYESQFNFVPDVGSEYLWKGFLFIQKTLDLSFIEKINGSTPDINIQTQEFPYPPYTIDSGMSGMFIHGLPLITLFSFIFVCPAVLKSVVEEKHSGIKELMKMVGMRPWMLWLGWLIYSMLPMILSVLFIITIMKVDLFGVDYPLIEYADGSVLYVFLILYCTAATVTCFFLSTLFKKPILATLVGILYWILTYFVPKYAVEGRDNVPWTLDYGLLLLPNIALHYGYKAISFYEEREIGINWTNLHIPGGGGSSEITMLNVWLMLIFDVFLYMLLTLYLDGILPGEYGVPKSVLFPFKPLLRFFKRKNHVDINNTGENVLLRDVELGKRFDKGIELYKLDKVYGGKTVVNNLSMDIYKGQITVLLGHNGAGKTTTMGMITGMVKKSGGKILMNGKEIDSSFDVTDSIGLCPQHNLFFPDLTVTEHLEFFAMLKGRSREEYRHEIASLLKKLDLMNHANAMAQNLSGGMKRKLCLGMAVVGGSKILILDEPSSGMDPESRRHMWDLLLSWRNDKTILITTHFMEEADALGDWIAIMKEGKMACYGTPMFLKKQFETGYNLSLLIGKDVEDIKHAVMDLEKEISKFVNYPQLKSVNGNEVVFLLPFESNYINMFEHLESNKDAFKIDNMSFTSTTLEDVFLHTNTSEVQDDTASVNLINKDVLLKSATKGSNQNYGLNLHALFFKRYRFIYLKMQTYLIPCVISLLFLALCIFLAQGANNFAYGGGPALKIKLGSYGKTTVMFNSSGDPVFRNMEKFYGDMVRNEKSDLRVVNNISGAIIEEGTYNLPYYRHHMVAAAEFSRNDEGHEAIAMYNNLASHSAPISLNLITNTIAKAVLGEEYSISVTNHPLTNNNPGETVDQLSEVQIGLLWLIIMPLGYLFFLGSFIYFPFVELSTNFTQLQLMSGCPAWFYWLITYVFDFLVYVGFVLVMSGLLSLFWAPFRGGLEFAALFVILVLYGICGIPFAYLFGRRKSFAGAYALFIILGIMLGVLLTVIVWVLEESKGYYAELGNKFRIASLIFFPQFGLTYSGVKFARKVVKIYNFEHMPKLNLMSVCSREEPNPCCQGDSLACQAHKNYFNLIEPDVKWMLLGAFIYFFANVLIHSYWLRKGLNAARLQLYSLFKREWRYLLCSSQNDDTDGDKTKTLRVHKLNKSYSGREVVNNVEFDLKKGECMGILGVNGAGKTTTFRMLTQEEMKDNGNIKINGFNINQSEYLKNLGYCPQNDALNYSLTGRDILKTMALLRGINDDVFVHNFLKVFGLDNVADIPCEYYSGGNKRKLSFAVAVIGIPDVILLDEPTNGIDPSSKRKFWTLIKNIKDECKNSFVLTSHSMTECEALCNDLKIMKDGKIEKNGTIAKLRDELHGFDVKMKLRQSTDKITVDETDSKNDGTEISSEETLKSPKDLKGLKEAITKEYPKAEIKDEHPGLIHYYIKTEQAEKKRWSALFREFEEIKRNFPDLIEDYSLSEASLEDVFLDVARVIKPEELSKKKKKSKNSQ